MDIGWELLPDDIRRCLVGSSPVKVVAGSSALGSGHDQAEATADETPRAGVALAQAEHPATQGCDHIIKFYGPGNHCWIEACPNHPTKCSWCTGAPTPGGRTNA